MPQSGHEQLQLTQIGLVIWGGLVGHAKHGHHAAMLQQWRGHDAPDGPGGGVVQNRRAGARAIRPDRRPALRRIIPGHRPRGLDQPVRPAGDRRAVLKKKQTAQTAAREPHPLLEGEVDNARGVALAHARQTEQRLHALLIQPQIGQRLIARGQHGHQPPVHTQQGDVTPQQQQPGERGQRPGESPQKGRRKPG